MTNIVMIISLLMNSIVILSAYLVTRRILKISAVTDIVIALFLFYLAQITVTELALGILGRLTLKNVIFLNLAVLLALILSFRGKTIFAFDKIASLAAKSSLARNDNRKLLLSGFVKNKAALLLASIIVVFGLVKVSINLVNPPFGWDSLNYHFTFAVEWLKNANLNVPITVFDDPSPTYYPVNASLFYLWLIFPLKNVFLADLGQAPFFVLSFLALYAIARKIGLAKINSFYCAGLFLIIPNFFKQLSIAYVDVMTAGLFLACVSFLLSMEKDFSYKYALLYNVSLGLLLGLKTIALPYGVLLFLPFFYLCAQEEFRRRGHLNVPLKVLLASPAIIIILGGFSYIRNFLASGNPLYPLNFKLFGRTIFKGVIDNAVYRAHFRIEDYALAKMLFHEGLGLQTLIFVLPGIFLALPIAILKKRLLRPIGARNDINVWLIYFLILPILVYLVYRYLIPLANVRYLYALLGLGMALGFYTAQMLNIPKKVIGILTGLCALASMPELAKRQELVVSIILTAALFFLAPYFINNLSRLLRLAAFGGKARNDSGRLFFILGFAVIFFTLVFLNGYYTKNEFPNYRKMVKYSGFWPHAADAWGWLNKETRGNNIAYAGRPVPFPLYGTNFKNNVYYASVNKTDPARLEYFPKSHYYWAYDFKSQHKNFEAVGNYRSLADYAAWLENLSRRKTDYLFIYSLHQTKDIEFPIEDAWAEAHKAQFKPVFSNNIVHIYKMIK